MQLLVKFIRLFLGFFILALGIYIMRITSLGLNPWGTFHTGVSLQSGLQFGTVSQLTGLTIILLSLLLKIYPGIATVLNAFFCGFFINLLENINVIPIPNSILIKIIYFVIGLFLLAYGIYLYLSSNLGAGPRDGLMIGLVKSTKYSVRLIRTFIEISALILGVILGGPIGIGTLLAAALSGIILQLVFNLAKYDPKTAKHLTFNDVLVKFTD